MRSEPDVPVKDTGFPSGYFRIRGAGTNDLYLCAHWSETMDGNVLTVWTFDKNSLANDDASVFFVNSGGSLCCKRGGHTIDVIDNMLVIAHNRPPTYPWPNPWSHPLPKISYAPETRHISVKFHVDPVLSARWPRPEEEWKDRSFIVTRYPPFTMKMPEFKDIARWATASGVPASWTTRKDDQMNHVACVQEFPGDIKDSKLETMAWEIDGA